MSEYRPKFGDPIRVDQIEDPETQAEHLHRLFQQLIREEYEKLGMDDKEKIYKHAEQCPDCNTKLAGLGNADFLEN